MKAMSGNPFAQQRALATGRALAELDRGVVTITGPDRLSWLDSMTSQSIAGLRPGESAETLVLDPHGHVEHALRVVDDGETAWLLVAAEDAAALAAWLDRMRFLLRVEVADRSAAFLAVGFLRGGFAGEAALRELATAVWDDPWDAVRPGGWQYAEGSHPGAGWSWSEALVARERAAELDAAAPAGGRVPESAATALRIAAWRPDWSTEVDDRTIPHELDWLRSAVHLDKGCYRGQETVAKVHNLGHPPRRLVALHLDGSDSVYAAHGDPVLLGGDEAPAPIGVVTSAAVHYELGPIALAVVKRSADPAAPLAVEHEGVRIAAAQEVIVPPSAGATAEVPRIPRLGAVRR